MRLVDANKLAERFENLEAVALEQVLKYEPSEEHEKWKVWSAILTERTAFKFDLFDAPTIDAVEVVRCKDCVYYDDENHFCSYTIWAKPEGYCSGGERREDETN